MSWELKIISDLSEIPLRNGIYKEKEFQGRGQKIINMKELFGFNFIGNQEMKRVDLSDSEKERFLVKEGDLLFARRSLVDDGAGKTSIISNLLEDTTFESSMIRVRLNQKITTPLFYYYYFTSYEGRGRVLSLSTGVNVKGIKGSELNNLQIPFPPLETQKRIASILSTYDDLIENNLKRIKLLEETAQNIYKEWFVNFRFPNYEHTEFDAESGLPKGWEIDVIGNQLLTIKRNGKLKTDDYEVEGKYPIIDQGNGYIAGYTNNEEIVQETHLPVVVFGDHTRRVKFVNFPFVSGADGTQLMFPKNENLLPAYFYLSIKNIDLSNYAYARHYKFMKEQQIIIPDEKTLSAFNTKVYPLLEQTIHLFDYNQKLKEARDILLPRLMNRTIEV